MIEKDIKGLIDAFCNDLKIEYIKSYRYSYGDENNDYNPVPIYIIEGESYTTNETYLMLEKMWLRRLNYNYKSVNYINGKRHEQ